MRDFDPAVIEVFATTLYEKARWIILMYAITAGIAGAVLGAVFISASESAISPSAAALVLGGLGGLLGYVAGTNKAFHLKLQAQTALCQVAIEKNTRRT